MSDINLIVGNSLDELKKLDENSVDSIVTDPPYGLSFMGKKWDYDVPSSELWAEALRVLKPGGHLLAFAGTRTQHRMAVNIEDAGFEIRDMIAWVYGSGFPKSHNIGKAVDKIQGNDREEFTHKYASRRVESIKSNASHEYGFDTTKKTDTKGTSPHEGWGTNLKPALEPITVARKPISEKNIALNVLKWGTGGINIDGSRVKADLSYLDSKGNDKIVDSSKDIFVIPNRITRAEPNATGRFPANLIHDGSDEVVGLFPDTKQGSDKKRNRSTLGSFGMPNDTTPEYADSGSAARYFYCAKASKKERNKGLEGFEERIVNDGRETSIDNAYQRGDSLRANTHPTVKPVKLMQYLVKLVTPEGGTVLDPFNGSGTTGIACKLENFNYVGIELDPEYVKLSEARIEAWGNEPEQQELL